MYRRPSQLSSGAVYCSRECHGVAQRTTKTCPVCEKEYWGQKKTCSRSCANTNRTGISYDGRNGHNNAHRGHLLKEKLSRRRGRACERCGYSNYPVLQVHHVVPRASGGSDALRNLELLCPNCHMEIHSGYREGQADR